MKTFIFLSLLFCAQICRANLTVLSETASEPCVNVLTATTVEGTQSNIFDNAGMTIGVTKRFQGASEYLINQKAPVFYRGNLHEILQRYPRTLARLGIKIVATNHIRILDDRQINDKIDKFQYKNLLSGLHVFSVRGGENIC